MHILVGIVLALGLLFFWLSGHWFARVVAFLVFAGVAVLAGLINDYGNGGVYMIIGLILAWPVSGIPLYVQRYRVRHASLELALR